jgi:hypothetical protein
MNPYVRFLFPTCVILRNPCGFGIASPAARSTSFGMHSSPAARRGRAFATPPRSGGRGDASADDVPTPQSATYAEPNAAAVEAAERHFPPLAVDAGVAALRERFKLAMAEDDLMPQLKKFKPETILTGLKKRLRDHGLAKDRDSSGGGLAPIIVQRPAFDKCVFLANPMEAGADLRSLDLYSVPSKALAQVMVRRGYIVVGCMHLPEDETKLPPAVEERTRGPRAGAAGSHVEETAYAVPTQLTVPVRVMPIDTSPDAPTPAAQIVEQFEIKVMEQMAGGRVDVYSPMRLWTKTARKAVKFLANQSCPFSARCRIYCHVRQQLSDREPSEIELPYEKLRAEAQAGKREDGADGGKSDWFTRAVALAASHV